MDEKAQQRFNQLAALCGCSDQQSEQFIATFNALEPVEKARMNPIQFARKAQLDSAMVVDLFVRGAWEGLFEFGWESVCPLCGAVTHDHSHLDQLPEESFYCAFCDQDAESALDETIEVTFAPNLGVHDQPFDPHSDFHDYLRYFTSTGFNYFEHLHSYQSRHMVGHERLEPGAGTSLHVTLEPGAVYRLICLDIHSAVTLVVHDEPARSAPLEPLFTLKPAGFAQPPMTVAPGQANLQVVNGTEQRVWIRLIKMDMAEIAQFLQSRQEPIFAQRLTADRLLSNQIFRDLYGIQDLIPDLKLRIRSITMLFTDLKGSTALYERTGDLAAYRMVRDHFDYLKQVVKETNGAVVKTMGDAIMATFTTPADGVRAAIAMHRAMSRYTEQIAPEKLGLKVGIHTGPALTVNAGERLDFFGQTVNVAARVQALADAAEICLSPDVAKGASCQELLQQAGYRATTEQHILKGIQGESTVLRYRASNT
uniref:Putative Adenylate cyclase domain protein n=1 Tax=Magnetococcus massalia (strain MO-1) TaxID=451514 RepID=A0A1S7LP81_MAGMO|nr:adenylate/guanylate cyclase domain-containing protein [Candidatus Magnetococcus massalia]CRH08263.1 putative Adenylate cyclase domain protein [Candidatus Magnetococcus massalia]CRH08330.1 putative Adenylate cyclase domain protein [Candidatus Magnetococcus massalia]